MTRIAPPALAPLALVLLTSVAARAETFVVEDFSTPREWSYESDQVMGGESRGEAVIGADGAQSFARLRGEVSTANDGGFIQINAPLDGLPEGTTALRLLVRGNGETYSVNLVPEAATEPWQYYAAEFTAPADWTEITLPLADFEAERMEADLVPTGVVSIQLMAYGANYTAMLDVARIDALTD